MITLPKTLARSIKGKSNVSVTLKLLSSVINDIYKRGCINGNRKVSSVHFPSQQLDNGFQCTEIMSRL